MTANNKRNLNTKQEKVAFLLEQEEAIKQLITYDYVDILSDYESMKDYFGIKDPDVILYGFVLDHFSVLQEMFTSS
jgi:hypothetical protein